MYGCVKDEHKECVVLEAKGFEGKLQIVGDGRDGDGRGK